VFVDRHPTEEKFDDDDAGRDDRQKRIAGRASVKRGNRPSPRRKAGVLAPWIEQGTEGL
jgi:hypothetical protein